MNLNQRDEYPDFDLSEDSALLEGLMQLDSKVIFEKLLTTEFGEFGINYENLALYGDSIFGHLKNEIIEVQEKLDKQEEETIPPEEGILLDQKVLEALKDEDFEDLDMEVAEDIEDE